jgi:glycine cleavage system H protein
MSQQPQSNIIPPRELRCVWMDAGVVDFKLCDLNLCCEGCPFDAQIRQQLRGETRVLFSSSTTSSTSTAPSASLEAIMEQKIAELISPFERPDLPANRFFTPNHLWFLGGGTQTFTVGLDHVALHVLGPVCGVAFPTIPAKVPAHAPCAWVVHELGTVTLKSPVSGTITQVNEILKDAPHLVKKAPYTEGWIFRLQSYSGQSLNLQFLSRDEAAELFRKQANLLKAELLRLMKKKHVALGTTLHDGGTLLENLEDIVGRSSYFELVTRVLSLS